MPGVQQLTGQGVTQAMGRDGHVDLLAVVAQAAIETISTQGPMTMGEDLGGFLIRPRLQVLVQGLLGGGTQIHHPIFAFLADPHPEFAATQI